MKKLLFALILSLFFTGPALANGPDKGKPAPNLMGRTFDGKLYRLSKYKGRPKVINFFWIYCKPCKEEMPELAALEKKYPNVDFISVHTEEMAQEKIEAFMKKLSGAPSKVVMSTSSVKKQFQFRGLPFTTLLDKNNKVKLNLTGYTEANMRKLEKALKGL